MVFSNLHDVRDAMDRTYVESLKKRCRQSEDRIERTCSKELGSRDARASSAVDREIARMSSELMDNWYFPRNI